MQVVALVHALVVAILAAVALQTLLNHRTLPRLARSRAPVAAPRVAVLIPARDEARRIGAAVRRWAVQDYPDYEVIVLDDASSDATAAAAAAAGGPRVRVVRNDVLPDGWRGKPHACHRLRAETDAQILVFVDADVRPAPEALAAAVGTLAALRADAVSVLPRHESPSVAVMALVALQNWAPLALVPLWLPAARRRPMFAVTNGQCLVIRATAYDCAGGFAAVRDELGEDAAFGRRLVAGGGRLELVDGAGLLVCHPYRRAQEAWRANVRNLRTAFLGSRALLLFIAAATSTLVLVPPSLLLWGTARGIAPTPALTWLPLLEITLLLASRAISDHRARYAPWLVLSHPLALLATAAMALSAAVPRREIRWRNRRYATRARTG
jgi:chlorobactene glucosyltransferase